MNNKEALTACPTFNTFLKLFGEDDWNKLLIDPNIINQYVEDQSADTGFK